MNDNLMMYVMDCSWAGMICVIAKNEEDARNLMKKEENYSEKKKIKSYQIKEGTIVSNYGDL